MRLKLLSTKRQPLCLGLNVLTEAEWLALSFKGGTQDVYTLQWLQFWMIPKQCQKGHQWVCQGCRMEAQVRQWFLLQNLVTKYVWSFCPPWTTFLFPSVSGNHCASIWWPRQPLSHYNNGYTSLLPPLKDLLSLLSSFEGSPREVVVLFCAGSSCAENVQSGDRWPLSILLIFWSLKGNMKVPVVCKVGIIKEQWCHLAAIYHYT